MKHLFAAIAGFAVVLSAVSAGPAAAQSLTGNVSSGVIDKGESAAEFRIGVNSDETISSRAHIQHAFTDWYLTRVIGSFRSPDGGDWDFSGLTVENWFQWAEEKEDQSGFNGGVRFAYTFVDGGGPDEAAIRLTISDGFADAWVWRANLISEFETGDGSEGGAAIESRLQFTRALPIETFGSSKWRAGVEMFSEYGNTRDIPEFDDQAHQIGPVVSASWENGVVVQFGARVGISDGADDAMGKFSIGRSF